MGSFSSWVPQVVAAAMAASVALSSAAYATEACGIDAAKPVRGHASDTDGGTKPNARVTARIDADEGNFILVSSIQYDSNGSRKQSSSAFNIVEVEQVPDMLSPLAASTATFTVSCNHRNPFGTSSCTATANISAMQYPIQCLKTLLGRELDSIVTN